LRGLRHVASRDTSCCVGGNLRCAPAARRGGRDHGLGKARRRTDSYIDKPVEVIGYCAQGGVKGDVDCYQCSTEGDLYISTPDIKPDFAKRKIEENCGGLDVVERSAFCRAKISSTPQSVSTSTTLESGKTITIIATDIATLKF
jgi:hypothetical protein